MSGATPVLSTKMSDVLASKTRAERSWCACVAASFVVWKILKKEDKYAPENEAKHHHFARATGAS